MTEEQLIELELNLKLPASLVHEAESQGLLTPEMLETMLREEVRRCRVANLFKAADRLAALPIEPLTEAEIEAEIQAVRAEKRSQRASDC